MKFLELLSVFSLTLEIPRKSDYNKDVYCGPILNAQEKLTNVQL